MTDNAFHFEDEAWIGFARRILPAPEAARMQAHLDDGCAGCAATHRLWGLVAEIAALQPQYEPPRDVVEAVKAAFPLAQRASLLPYIARPAKMTLDSSRGPLPAGFRGSATLARQLLYETDDFLINLRLECDEERRIALTGQIVPRDSARAVSQEVSVLVTGDKGRPLRHSMINSLGEFQMDVEEQKLLAVYMQFSDSTIASIVLRPPTT
jgi:hypothetical protein